ncbi:MAG TPA: hypothetical protein VGM88_27620 [Kofleriaceae bacterium]
MRRLLLIAIVLGGCVTPSIPIPPPDPAKMDFDVTAIDQASTAVFTYPAEDNYSDSTVYIFNRDQGTGIITLARGDGSVGPTQPVSAAIGDQVVVTFQREDQDVSTCVRLRQGSQSAVDYCD